MVFKRLDKRKNWATKVWMLICVDSERRMSVAFIAVFLTDANVLRLLAQKMKYFKKT